MLWAQLKGKVSVGDEGSEDLLTSNVFGTLKYVAPMAGLIPVLSRAIGDHANELRLLLRDVERVEVEFWPWVEEWPGNGCEPDVLLRVAGATGPAALVVIEAKYLSGKSSLGDPAAVPGSPPRDQLAREWVNCERLGRNEGTPVFLVFLTADHALPAQELRDSQADLARCGLEPGRLLWLSWRHVAAMLPRDSELLCDLRALLERRYGFRSFDGVRLAVRSFAWEWSGARPPTNATPSAEWGPWPTRHLRWRFAATTARAIRPWPNSTLSWRYARE